MKLLERFFQSEESVMDEDICITESLIDDDYVGSRWKGAALGIFAMAVLLIFLIAFQSKAPVS